MQLIIVDWCYFKIHTLNEILRTQDEQRASFFDFWRRSFALLRWMWKKAKVSVSQFYRIRNHIFGCWFACGRFTHAWLLDLVIEVLGMTQEYRKPTQACTLETGVKTYITPNIQQMSDHNKDLSNMDHVLSNAPLWERSRLYMFEDNEVVKKMIVKGRSPTMRHVSRTHRVAQDWWFDRIDLGQVCRIQRNQFADILSKGSSTRDDWHSLLHFFSFMNDTTFWLLFQPFFSFRKKAIWNVEQISGKLFSWFADGVASNPQSPGSTKDFTDGVLFSMLEKPKEHAKSRSEHQRLTKTRWNHLENIDHFWQDAHFRYGRELWLHWCR